MKTILCALITLPFSLAFAASGPQVDTIHTLHGKTYRKCRIIQRDPDGVAFTHSKGTARLLFNDLPQTTCRELGYSPQEAAALERSRELARQDRAAEQRLRQKRADELRHAARLAQIKRLGQQPVVIYPQGIGGSFLGPVPAVGFAAPGWSQGGYGYGYGGGSGQFYGRRQHGYGGWQFHPHRNHRGWEGVGIANIVPGTGGVYAPQSGGFIFTNMPQVHYSPTLGYYNPGYYARPPVPTLGTFGFVPGLAPPNPSSVVPGAGIRGSVSLPASR